MTIKEGAATTGQRDNGSQAGLGSTPRYDTEFNRIFPRKTDLEEIGQRVRSDLTRISISADFQDWWRTYRAVMGDTSLADILLHWAVPQ